MGRITWELKTIVDDYYGKDIDKYKCCTRALELLEIFEIIIEKKVNLLTFNLYKEYTDYNFFVATPHQLTKKEFEKIKKILDRGI